MANKPRQTLDLGDGDVRSRIKRLLAEADKSRPLLEAVIKNACRRLGNDTDERYAVIAPSKVLPRAYNKIVYEYGNDVALLCDACRGMQIIDDDDGVGLKNVANFYRNNPNTVSFKDKILNPTDNGFCRIKCEIQAPKWSSRGNRCIDAQYGARFTTKPMI